MMRAGPRSRFGVEWRVWRGGADLDAEQGPDCVDLEHVNHFLGRNLAPLKVWVLAALNHAGVVNQVRYPCANLALDLFGGGPGQRRGGFRIEGKEGFGQRPLTFSAAPLERGEGGVREWNRPDSGGVTRSQAIHKGNKSVFITFTQSQTLAPSILSRNHLAEYTHHPKPPTVGGSHTSRNQRL